MGKTGRKARKRDDVAAVVAVLHGVTPRYVNMVRAGIRKNEDILASCVDYEVGKTVLLKSIEKLIPVPVKQKAHEEN